MEVATGEFIRFFARYGGSSQLHEAFSLGVTKDEPDEIASKVEHNGTTYYIDSYDDWFFGEYNLHVNVNPNSKELIYSYEKA